MINPETPGLQPQVGVTIEVLHGQDYVLADNNLNLYGVFDGLGGHAGSEEAARIASESIQMTIEALSSDYTDETSLGEMHEDLVQSVAQASEAITTAQGELQKPLGLTTATVARLVEKNGQTALLWASVGDSRLYIRTSDDEITQISEDEGEENFVSNTLGSAKLFQGVHQRGMVLPLEPGDEIVLVTDGITGDIGEDILSNDEILAALVNAPTAEDASQELINISRKRDDKTAIVVRL
jgi:serine/threonine protein phosphatase PrpC